MKTSAVIVTTLLAAFLLTAFVPAVAQTEAEAEVKADPTAPFVTSVDAAKQAAAERGEKALLLFYTDW
jgi:ABC-type sugar transport system substrate-binding protein